jgi:hypothetical protein
MHLRSNTLKIQKEQSICEWKEALPQKPAPGSKLGIAISTIGQLPINGLRHKPENGTNGWYIWCGMELSDADEFFSPLHVEHIADYLPEVAGYLDLPPGYRFQIDGKNYEDVWFDAELLNA